MFLGRDQLRRANMVHRRKGLTKIMTLYRIGMFTSVSSFGIQQIKNTIRVILGAYYFFYRV